MLPDFGWLAEITWAWPWAFLALPLPLLVWWLAPIFRPPAPRALRVPDTGTWADLQDTGGVSTRHWSQVLLLVLMWLALVIALARPQAFDRPFGIPQSGRDLMLCIDISGSMRERDLYAGNTRASRMAVVKEVGKAFIARRAGDRIGLIMFGSEAYVQTPLTLDHVTLAHFLDEAAVGLAGRTTAIGDAIGLGVKRLRKREEQSRVLILLTDGENSAGVVAPLQAARLAADSGIRIHTIGIGSDGRDSGGGLGFGSRGTELDERTLKSIADETGGKYYRARNQRELEDIYAQIDRLEPTVGDREALRPLRELYAWPLAAALLLSVVWAGSSLPAGKLGFVSARSRGDE